MIKKVILAVFVVATFAIYSIQQRTSSTPAVATTSTKTTQSTPSSSTIPTTTTAATTTATTTGQYKDGTYTGTSEDAFYGFVQVKAVISGGKITSVVFLSYPSDHRESQEINSQAMPILQQEAIKAQSANVDIVSGATDTSQAFIQSLSSALNSAKA